MGKTMHLPPISSDRLACLAGITLGDAEPGPETVTFHLETSSGARLDLDFHTMLAATGLAMREGAIPSPGDDWIGRAVNLTWVDELWC